jgi:L-2-hydroxyglutarate oxidase LhgO
VTERVDCVVVGAGVVGLAVARALAAAGREVLVLEAEDAIGTHASSRNSEVVHAGLYYPAGSLKARLCVHGRELLYAYCDSHGVPHRRIGKIVVATDASELAAVQSHMTQAHANGVRDLEWLSGDEIGRMEPAVRCIAGFHSPSTGIVDSHALMLALQGDAERARATLVLRAPVESGDVHHGRVRLHVGGRERITLDADTVINAAGLFAPDVARSIAGFPRARIPPRHFAKAHYFTLSGRSPFSRLVYPVASATFLGVHVTLDLAGQARFGPDIEWVDSVDYSFDESRAPLFYDAVRRYFPDLRDGALQPGYTGVRAKISSPGDPAADFLIEGPREHGIGGLVNLFGIESPGLTSSLAIGAYVADILRAAP